MDPRKTKNQPLSKCWQINVFADTQAHYHLDGRRIWQRDQVHVYRAAQTWQHDNPPWDDLLFLSLK